MEANDFVTKLKADGSENDQCDLDKVYQEYKSILAKLAAKDRGPFSLNVLCILCRNLDKVPSWCSAIDTKALLTLTITCVRETRCVEKPDQVKTLACIYHIHKYIVRQKSQMSPELVLKISYMPFENETENLLREYCKTYWGILTDRFIYIEKLKAGRVSIIKLLAKLTDDTVKVIQMCDTIQFCSAFLVNLVKKLHVLYNDVNPTELNKTFGKIFEELSKKKDLKLIKKLSEKELLDLYAKFSDCMYVIAENSSKTYFKDNVLNFVVRTFISILGHSPDLFHCLQTFYLNSFCSIITEESNVTFNEAILNSIQVSCEMTEKLGYVKALNVTYPYLNQFLRLYIEYAISNTDKFNWTIYFTTPIQEGCLKLILFLMTKLKTCEQLTKCENCKVKSGLHDALRLSFIIKNFVSISVIQKIDIATILPVYHQIVEEQHALLINLCTLGCSNYEKCYMKLQTDTHNTAILLNKSQHYEFSIKLFDTYVKNEIKHFKNETHLKNISRALYNKSICELDYKLFDRALKDAYLSLIFAYPEALNSEKHMSLVMDIKAKVLKAKTDETQDEENQDSFQMITILNACIMSIEDDHYGNLKPFLFNLKFSELLKHEFSSYVKLWPSIVPIAGIWTSLYELTKNKLPWMKAHDDNILQTLYEIVLETATVVRTIHSEYYVKIVTQLLENFENHSVTTAELRVIYATLMFLKAEYDMTEASNNHGWKVTESNLDPDQTQAVRTLPQEHAAMKSAERGLHVWIRLLQELDTVPKTSTLNHALQTAQVLVQQFLHQYKLGQGLQLAHICCRVAHYVGDKPSYIRNAGTILYYASKSTDVQDIVKQAGKYFSDVVKTKETMETALVFVSESAIYYIRCGEVGTAAKLVQLVQARILKAYSIYPEINLDLAVGLLLEAQYHLCKYTEGTPSALSTVTGIQRHFLTTANKASKWSTRRAYSLTLKRHMWCAGAVAAALARGLLSWRRARSAAGGGLPPASAVGQAILFATITNTYMMDDAQTKIDLRIKHILGLQPSNEIQRYCRETESKTEPFTPKQEIETMRENMFLKKSQTSPSSPYLDVPSFKMPEFLKHKNCLCYACQDPNSLVLALQMCGLESSVYFRAKEFDIAKNYFEGTFKCFKFVEQKSRWIFEGLKKNFDCYIVDIVQKLYNDKFRKIELEILIESAFFELSLENYKMADEKVVRIHEIIEEVSDVDPYLKNEVMNLMTCSARLRKVTKKQTETGLEVEMDSLKLSPAVDMAIAKTPESKLKKPPEIKKIVVSDEEVPKTKRRIIKQVLNFDESSSDDKEITTKKPTKKTSFKIPVPVTKKPALESLTPARTPRILVTQPSIDESTSILDIATPKPIPENEFFTPQSTPSEQFFTPMTSVKTYSKKSLRHGIVKNLQSEFSTPKTDKENNPITAQTLEVPSRSRARAKVETGSLKVARDKKMLKRATSPGKLVKEEKSKSSSSRPSRIKKPVQFSFDDDKK